MKVLLDECLPERLLRDLPGHDVRTVRLMNWQGLSNGRLLAEAESHFDAFITVVPCADEPSSNGSVT